MSSLRWAKFLRPLRPPGGSEEGGLPWNELRIVSWELRMRGDVAVEVLTDHQEYSKLVITAFGEHFAVERDQ